MIPYIVPLALGAVACSGGGSDTADFAVVPSGLELQMEDESRTFDTSNACAVGRSGPNANLTALANPDQTELASVTLVIEGDASAVFDLQDFEMASSITASLITESIGDGVTRSVGLDSPPEPCTVNFMFVDEVETFPGNIESQYRIGFDCGGVDFADINEALDVVGAGSLTVFRGSFECFISPIG